MCRAIVSGEADLEAMTAGMAAYNVFMFMPPTFKLMALSLSMCMFMCRAIASGEADLEAMAAGIAEVEGQVAALQAEADDKAGDIEALRTEKEIQAGGEVKELQEEVDKLAMK
jgi:hypothetical protein